MLVLFFDTFIAESTGNKGGSYGDDRVARVLGTVRDFLPTYGWVEKIDIVKYTLCSYAVIPWDRVIIRFECEVIEETDAFREFCHSLFPSAVVKNERSATAIQYYAALSAYDLPLHSWIFFSPNNDHPYLASPDALGRYLEKAKVVAARYPGNDVSLLFSHFTESILDNRITDPQWGYFGFKFKRVLHEDHEAFVTISSTAPLDSIQVFQLKFLLRIFLSTQNVGRVIRLEDTEFCSAHGHRVIQVAPKAELCRHFDGYTHIMNKVPPLFIPDGFFAKEIKIRYGYLEAKAGWVSINPTQPWISRDIDLPILLSDIPYFWRERIKAIDVNPEFTVNEDRSQLTYYKNFHNPWAERPVALNVMRSLYIYVVLQSLKYLRLWTRFMLIKIGFFQHLKNGKKRFRNWRNS